MDIEDIWVKFLSKIKSKVSLMSYNYIFKDLRIHSYDDSKIVIIVPNNELLLQNITKNYVTLIEDTLNDITNDTCTIEYIFQKDVDKLSKKKEKPRIIEENIEEDFNDLKNYKYSSNFNPKHTFDTFIVGDSNKLAYGTAMAVAQNPGKLYNPYFIYAKSGLGKTHLMHAIGNYIVLHSDKRVLYIKAEEFANDYRAIINTKNKYGNNITYLEAFREKYRDVDVLMIDDIQFLDNKVKSQMEFTNTFNSLYENEKQIVIASDRSINDYELLEERLKTRFRWGLTSSINPPDIDLKKNIIKNKIMVYNFDLDIKDEVVEYIASNCTSDIRTLEGAITRVYAYATIMNGSNIDLPLAMEALKDYFKQSIIAKNDIDKVLALVSEEYNISVAEIKSKKRNSNIAIPRQVAMFICRTVLNEPLTQIGKEFGGKDHTTVMHSVNKIENEIKNNIELKNLIDKLINKLK